MTLCDASALVALINRRDNNHNRCVDALPKLTAPLITTWSCFTEAMHLLDRYGGWAAQQELWGYLADQLQLLIMHVSSESEQERMQVLMEQYRDIPMDLGDASLVAMAETLNQQKIFTLDRDFYIYRLPENQPFDAIP